MLDIFQRLFYFCIVNGIHSFIYIYFFFDNKVTRIFQGKITKSVEDKITEIKARNNEEGSPQHRAKLDKTSELKTIKDSKENSSVSDSEDLSESSISRTCGIVSTTEGTLSSYV